MMISPAKQQGFESLITMNKKEIAEIKRRFKLDQNTISRIYGCYVNAGKEIISKFDTYLGRMGEEETEMYLKVLKKVLSGTPGKNLHNLEFSVKQVESGAEHNLLMKLRDSDLRDDDARDQLIEKIIESVSFEDSNFLILLASDTYDVPYIDRNDEELDDGSGEVFKYFVCAVCPVKAPSLELKYYTDSREFHTGPSGQVALSPEVGFMFPAFTDRTGSIYEALYYAHKPAELFEPLLDQVFGLEAPMSAPSQKATFDGIMEETIMTDLSFEAVQSINEEVRNRIDLYKEEKNPEIFEMSVEEIGGILKTSGIAEEKVTAFVEEARTRFGGENTIKPQNIIEPGKFHVVTPEIKITVKPEDSYLIETKVINGRKYILIPADDGVTINGLSVNIVEKE